jgi:Tol biopolymer transport system component
MRRLLAGWVLLLATGTASWAQVPPDAEWRTLDTEHFRITFPRGLEALARHTAERAEIAYGRLASRLAPPPAGTIDILLTDFVDVSNGSATPFPSNRIVVYARPPVDEHRLAYFGDWIDLVVTHELTHVFHLDGAGGLGRVVRRVLGRYPWAWPVFPAIESPLWAIEGIATHMESALTGVGRVNGSYFDMSLRAAVLEGSFFPIDRVTGGTPLWPAGNAAYIYGALFFDDLARRHGTAVDAAVVARTQKSWLPPEVFFDRVGRGTLGRSFTDAFAEWRGALEERYHRLADSLRASGVTTTERLPGGGYFLRLPRVGVDGRVVFASYDGRSAPATRILDPSTGRVERLARRNGLDAAAWLPDGSVLTAQGEWSGPYRYYSDLVQVTPDGRERRLTRGARLSSPDPLPDGSRAVAVQATGATTRLVVVDLETGDVSAITPAEPDVHWAYPRWSPSGEWIAAARWRRGHFDVVVLDPSGRVVRELTADRAIDAMPAWSADGRYVIFSSDRSGIPNLYAADLAAEGDSVRLFQVTNVLTGAFDPDISPDGRWIYFAAYHADGYHIERIPFDPATWRAPAPLDERYLVAELEAPYASPAGPSAVGGAPRDDRLIGDPRPYSAWPTLRPQAWEPVGYDEGGLFLGARIEGVDLVGRHAFSIGAAVQPRHGLFDGTVTYEYAGLGNPVLGFSVWRRWDEIPIVPPEEAPSAALYDREDGASVTATFLRRRARSAARLTIGGEGVAERRRLFDAPGLAPAYTGTNLLGAFVQAGFATDQTYPFSISRENGVSLSGALLRRWDLERTATASGVPVDRSYTEALLSAAGFLSLRGPGFANHVLAVRLAGAGRTGPGADLFGIGSASGAEFDLGPLGAIEGRRFLPVRGFGADARVGTRAWTATVEYRFPLALVGRGYRLWPLYLDRVSGAAFLDAGDAWCTPEQRSVFTGCGGEEVAPLVGAGGELIVDMKAILWLRLRAGIGFPIHGAAPGSRPTAYLRFGSYF